jgi:hypothetical protein
LAEHSRERSNEPDLRVDCIPMRIEYAKEPRASFEPATSPHWMIIMTSLSMATSRLINGSSTAC